MKPSISILIITYNRPNDLLAFLFSLKEQIDYDVVVGEVLILNNASTDSYQEVEEFAVNHPELKIEYISHSENLGVAKGRNFLFRKAKHPIFLILDDDMVFPDIDALKKLSSLFSKPHFQKNNTGIITFSVLYFENGQPQKSAFPHKKYEELKNEDWFLTYYFAGGANITLKKVIDDIGLLAEDFFYGMEEYDLSYRMICRGYTLGYDSSVKILHKESPLGRLPKKEQLTMMWFNKSKVAWKYLPTRYFYSTALLWSIFYLKNTRFDLPGFFKNWKKIIQIPKNVAPRKISNQALQYLKSVNARLWY